MYLRGRGRVAGLSTAIGGKSSAIDVVFHAVRGIWTPGRVRCHFLHMTTRVIVCGYGTHLQNLFLAGFSERWTNDLPCRFAGKEGSSSNSLTCMGDLMVLWVDGQ
jgi:hypothetical protein